MSPAPIHHEPSYSTPPPIARSYRATYQLGMTFFVREFIACDDFLHAVEQADDAREGREHLVNVTAVT